MMINKRLIGTVTESRKYIAGNVALQWVSLAANIVMMASITRLTSPPEAIRARGRACMPRPGRYMNSTADGPDFVH